MQAVCVKKENTGKPNSLNIQIFIFICDNVMQVKMSLIPFSKELMRLRVCLG